MKQQALIPTLERVVRGFCQLKGMGELTAS